MPDSHRVVSVRPDAPLSAGTALAWSAPCASRRDAAALAKQLVADGDAVLAVVVWEHDGRREALQSYVWPKPARTVIGHWVEITESL